MVDVVSKRGAEKLPVAIVGAGFSGTLLAVNLLRLGARVVLIEREAGLLAKGLAYSTRHPGHLLNVRASNMSAYADDPNHFLGWMGFDTADQANRFVPRLTYGHYVHEQLLAELTASPDRIQILAGEATGVAEEGDAVVVALANGAAVRARAAVLALGNFPPPPFTPFDGLPDGLYYADPWHPGATRHLDALDHILLLGTGLTAVDIALSLESAGYRGRITALSRRGLAPRSHADSGPVVGAVPCPEARGSRLVRHVRERVAYVGWRAAIDELRPHTQSLWRRHDEAAQRRFLRHLRPWWDVHRHRLAPQVAESIAAMERVGRLEFVAGKVGAARGLAGQAEVGRVEVTWRRRGAATQEALTVGRIINCTGPAGDVTRATQPLLRDLLAAGRVRPDVHRLGLDVDHNGRVKDEAGRPQDRLFAVGPVTKGEAWEIIAVPDVRRQVWNLARLLTSSHWVGGEGL